MTPKSLLRHPEARSAIGELTDGAFRPVLPGVREETGGVTRLVLCSGKVFYDLTGSDAWAEATTVDVVRVEMLYPFPEDELRSAIEAYPALTEVIWLQEEPANMGAWRYLCRRLEKIAGPERSVRLVARPERASPAAGTTEAHNREQQALIQAALTD